MAGKTGTTQLDGQLHERRRALHTRRTSFDRIQLAGDELERRIEEVVVRLAKKK